MKNTIAATLLTVVAAGLICQVLPLPAAAGETPAEITFFVA